jgi:ATP-dependent protease ClpP protease subunit
MVWAEPEARAEVSASSGDEESEDEGVARCPFTTMTDQDKCLWCHCRGRDFKKIKETDPHDQFDYPALLKVYEDDQGKYGFFTLNIGIREATPVLLEDALRYLARHGIRRIIIDIESPGGSIFSGWKVVTVIEQYKAMGFDVTTQVRSIAASAAFIIFCAADKRLMSPTVELMMHELATFTFFEISTPTDSKKKTKLLNHFQDTINSWLAKRVGMTKEAFAQKLRDQEYWMNGAQAKSIGWATGYLYPVDPEIEKALLDEVIQY